MLMYANEGLAIVVEFDRRDSFDGKAGWTCSIVEAMADGRTLGTVLHTDDTLRTVGYDIVGALRTLVTFLQAWDEAMRSSYEDSENRTLFPAELHERVDWSAWLDEAYCDLTPEDER